MLTLLRRLFWKRRPVRVEDIIEINYRAGRLVMEW